MTVGYDEQASIAEARALAYSFFADVFSTEASKDFIASMATFEAVEGSLLAQFASSLSEADLDKVVQDVRCEFSALFLNMSAHPVFTSESVYLSENHVIMQEQRTQVLGIYREHDLAVDKTSFDWPEDHISMEMLFMSHLCKREVALCHEALEAQEQAGALQVQQSVSSCVQAERAFFTEHLDRWVPLFAKELARHAETLFYRGVAEYLGEFLEGERECLSGK